MLSTLLFKGRRLLCECCSTTQFQYVPPYGYQFLFRWMISVQSSVVQRHKNKLIKIDSVKVCINTIRTMVIVSFHVQFINGEEQTATLHMVQWSILENPKKIRILGFWLIHQNESNSKRAKIVSNAEWLKWLTNSHNLSFRSDNICMHFFFFKSYSKFLFEIFFLSFDTSHWSILNIVAEANTQPFATG